MLVEAQRAGEAIANCPDVCGLPPHGAQAGWCVGSCPMVHSLACVGYRPMAHSGVVCGGSIKGYRIKGRVSMGASLVDAAAAAAAAAETAFRVLACRCGNKTVDIVVAAQKSGAVYGFNARMARQVGTHWS